MERDLISVIVPVYKVENFLDRCVDSLINQTYKNIEIILVDDGSPDKCPQICEEWARQDYRVKVIHKENGGLSDARNKGLESAKGKYICFVDSDDYVNKTFVENLYKTLINNNVNIACIGLQEFNDDTCPENDKFYDNKTEVFETEEAIRYLFGSEKYQNYAWNKIYLKDLFNDVKYPKGRKMEDLGTTYLLFDKCKKIAYNPARLYYYYQRENSILHQVNHQFCIDKYYLAKQRYLYVSNKYPNIADAYLCFFSDCLTLAPYQTNDENLWIKNELKKIWPKVRKEISFKQTLKYRIYRYANKFYLRKFKKC